MQSVCHDERLLLVVVISVNSVEGQVLVDDFRVTSLRLLASRWIEQVFLVLLYPSVTCLSTLLILRALKEY